MKIINIVAFFTLIFSFIIVLTVGIWELYPYKTINFKENPWPILNLNHQVKSGGYLLIQIDYCKYTNIIPMVSRTFADDVLYVTEPIPTSKRVAGCGTDVFQVYVPKGLPLGKYTLRSTYKYKVNPLRDIDIFTETEPFIIE